MIRFEKFERSDFYRLIAWVDSPKLLLQWAGPIFSYPLNIDQLESYLSNSEKETSNVAIYKILYNDRVIGHIELCDIDEVRKSAMLTRVLIGDPKERNLGLGQKICKIFIEYAYNMYKLCNIDLFVFDDNHSAMHCYQKIGFNEEAYFPKAWHFGGSLIGIHHLRFTRSV